MDANEMIEAVEPNPVVYAVVFLAAGALLGVGGKKIGVLAVNKVRAVRSKKDNVQPLEIVKE